MPVWGYFIVIFLHILSWIIFLAVYERISHVTKSHIKLLGEENKDLIQTKRLAFIKLAHFSLLLIFTVVSFVLLNQYYSL